MKRWLLIVPLAACGSKTTATPTTVAATQPSTRTAATSCADVGVVMSAIDATEGDTRRADRAKDIERQCTRAKWTRKMVECIGGSTSDDIAMCLDNLTPVQQNEWAEMNARWAEADANIAVMMNGVVGGQVGGYPTVTLGGGAPPEPPPPPIDCNSAVADAGRYPPQVPQTDGDRSFTNALRTFTLNQSCGSSWSMQAKTCLSNASGTDEVKKCLAEEPAIGKDIAARIAASDALMRRTAQRRRGGGDVSCAATAAVHYADAAWKGKLPASTKDNERRKIIDESRAKMTKACTDDSWSDDLRACLGSEGADACFAAAGVPALWTYPPGGVFGSTGIPECDAYAAEVSKMMVCSKVPQATRDALKQSVEQSIEMMRQVPAGQRTAWIENCQMAQESIRQMEMADGCAP